ncbi:protein kinase domain-containing protein [Virgibacillus salexigens]|uniref:Protein kinase domain protein n=2 Tax=Virgibacillus TaxID=84406 RepID=A0A024Q5E0_9BACI|nr:MULTISPECIES: serine/threonine-protein kinase [Virgibacillus]GGJ57224.1 putative serine/threonine-protein kinase YabT [Virgibacillus kapii]CDQ37758.1 Protein kinase domain protein [Virgibacillus massiliensis]
MKMNQEWKKHSTVVRPGMYIQGKWHKKVYVIKQKLGAGAIGSVYLCEANGKPAALKISDKRSSMTVEVNVLKSLGRVQGSRLGPSLLDVDDWTAPSGEKYSFYVMEYLQGEPMSAYIRRHGKEWIGVFMLQLLEDLEQLHQHGWVFGDLKIDNLLIVLSPPRVRWVDVGGTTQVGRAIKEYTEFYDRGYWGMGTRKAEPSYDLFAFVMVFLTIYYPNRFNKDTQPEKMLFRKIDEAKGLRPYRLVLRKALIGKYVTSSQMKKELLQVIHNIQKQNTVTGNQAQPTKQDPFLLEAAGISFLAASYYLISLLFQ